MHTGRNPYRDRVALHGPASHGSASSQHSLCKETLVSNHRGNETFGPSLCHHLLVKFILLSGGTSEHRRDCIQTATLRLQDCLLPLRSLLCPELACPALCAFCESR